jgi:putative endonuclease
MFSVYILYSKAADKYYIGHTEDVQRRLFQHNNPIRKSKFTAKALPWNLITFFPFFHTRSEAMKAEKFIKAQKSRMFLEKLSQLPKDEVKLIFFSSTVG